MSSFVHCNKCFKMPSPGDNFFFTSCGHILCEGCKCNGTANQTVPMLDEGKQICSACSRQAGIVPINRNMRPDIMELFKPPAVLLQEYTQKLGKAISFQAYQRERMFKRQQEMYNKAIQRMLGAQKELKKWTEKERSLLEEKKRLATELERQQANVLNLTTLLNSTANRTINNDNMHNNTATSGSNHTMHDSPSLSNGNTPNIQHRHGHHHHLQQQQFLSMTLPPPPLSSRSAIRTRRLEAVVFGSAGHRPTVSSPSASSSISAFHRPRPTPPLMPGRITKGPVLPPSFLPHPHRRRD